jgi:hypothetical protein
MVNRPSRLLVRVALQACPADFRRAHGADVIRTVHDRCRHGGEPVGRVVVREVVDVALAASCMRWEQPMSRTVLLALVATASIVGALVGGPAALVPVAGIVGVAACMLVRSRRLARPLEEPHRWGRWLAAGAVLVAGAVVIPVIDGGELDELWWSVAAVLLVGGLTISFVGLLTAVRGGNGGSPERPATLPPTA